MMRILVTGATGFLGQTLVKRLLSAGCEVTAIGRNLHKGQALAGLGADFAAVDLESAAALEQLSALLRHDALIHAAGLSSAWGEYSAFFSANVAATETAIKAARRLQCRRIIYISSPSIYFDWKDQLNIAETHPLPKPVNAYAATKRLAELAVLQAMDMSPVILRPRGLYGKDDSALLPRLTRALKKGALPLLRGGRAVTNLTYIDDCAEAICLALRAPDIMPARIFNIAGQESLAIRAIAEAVAAKISCGLKWRKLPVSLARLAVGIMEMKARLTPGRPEPLITAYGLGVFAYSQTLDCSLARKYLGFTPQVSFEQGLAHVFGGINP